ncbi:SGNH/GDSL hydrolase family protein [Kribbella yunnanensis]|uniref:SGNH/GDSL hydrolase family protein n=1 Tax=Kribbella yunnanensis TaxID=190194 RepID=UPI0031D9C508
MTATATPAIRYVALGDSSAAGPGIPEETDPVCLRSSRNWPHQLATLLGAQLTDVTCSGATTNDLAGRQAGVVPPQYEALRANTDLVTLAIGANDLVLGGVWVTCLPASEQSCQEKYTVNGVDQFAVRIRATAVKVATALEEIHRRSPRARVIVTGYLTYWQPGGCYPDDPFSPVDANYVQTTMDRLMRMLAVQAWTHNASYVDLRGPSAAHGLCAEPVRRWLEGATPAAPAYPYHPNERGMTNAARILAGTVCRTSD